MEDLLKCQISPLVNYRQNPKNLHSSLANIGSLIWIFPLSFNLPNHPSTVINLNMPVIRFTI